MYQRALQGYEKVGGPDHTSTLETVNNLGLLYAARGKLDEAGKMFQRALQGSEKSLGPGHKSTLDTVNNLGLFYARQGKLDEAEKMYQRALQGKEKTLGPDHTSTLGTVNNFGLFYKSQGEAVGLEDVPRYRPALTAIKNLGDLFVAQGIWTRLKRCTQERVLAFRPSKVHLVAISAIALNARLHLSYYILRKVNEEISIPLTYIVSANA